MTRKLWQAGSARMDPAVERFLAADDLAWDQRLVPYDLLGNAVQARVLVRAQVLTPAEGRRIVAALRGLSRKGLVLKLSDEDVHTRVEAELTRRLGPLGKKIHTGRSRNDQVLLDLALYRRGRLLDLRIAALELADACFDRARRHVDLPLPGYTHMQRAMPSSVGLWMGAWSESFADDAVALAVASEGSFPLGSASGYGSLVPADREYAADLAGFSCLETNVLHAQTSRGKAELEALHASAHLLLDCNRLASDGLLFSTAEFGFLKLPDSMTTGSSLMPNKRNADVWELVRAAYHLHVGDLTALASVQANLPSGYNRDLQVTKGLLMRALERAAEVAEVTRRTVGAFELDAARCREAASDPALLATDRATLLALSGVPFRDAYLATKRGAAGPGLPLERALSGKRSAGAPGNLRLETRSRERAEAAKELRSLDALSTRLLDPSWRMGR